MRRILFLARAEVWHVVRDRATLAQVLVLPILQLLVLSNAATFEILNTPVYIVDFDHTSASRGLVNRFRASGHFKVIGQSSSLDLGNEALLKGDVTMVLAIPHRLRKLARAHRRREGAAQRERRERIGGRHRAVLRVEDPSSVRDRAERRDAARQEDHRGGCDAARAGRPRHRGHRPRAGTTRRSITSTTWSRGFSSGWLR